MFDPEVLEEFKYEADDMLNESEDFLLGLEKGEDFNQNFNGVFRAFHSLKGAAGMFEIDPLQQFMHIIEGQFESLRNDQKINKKQIDYFLQAIDAARSLISLEEISFDTSLFDKMNGEAQPEVKETAAATAATEVKKEAEPLIKETKAQRDNVQERIEKRAKKKRGLVYVVDDEQFISEELCSILDDFGFTAVSFTNPEEVFHQILKEEPDLLCTDLKMPEMTGMELLEKIRKEKVNCPVIFVTGFIDNQLLTEGLDLGASGFLEKPFEEHQVVSLAKQVVDRHRTKKLLNRSISYILYQYNDLDKFLKSEGKEIQRENLKQELHNLLSLKKELS